MAVSNMGVIVNAIITAAASLAVATVATVTTLDIAKKQYRIGKRQLKLAEDKWDRFKDKYKPVESSVVAALWGETEYTPAYGATAGLYGSYAASSLGQFHVEFAGLSLCEPFDYVQARTVYAGEITTDAMNFAYRSEEAKADTLSDVLFNRRAQMLNLGRDCSALSARYAAGALEMYERVRNTAQDIGEGAGQLAGRSLEQLQQGLRDRETAKNARDSGVGGSNIGGSNSASAGNVFSLGMSQGNSGFPGTIGNAANVYKYNAVEVAPPINTTGDPINNGTFNEKNAITASSSE